MSDLTRDPPVSHRGAGIHDTPELLIRQVLMEGLVELAGDVPRLDELFGRVDTLRQGTQEEWTRDMRRLVQGMATPGNVDVVRVGVGYPQAQAKLPWVSIILASGAEQASGAYMGDLIDRVYEQVGTPSATDPSASRSIRHSIYGGDHSSQLQIGSWTTSPEMATALNATVKHLLMRHKGRMLAAGIHELSVSESGFQPDQQVYPRTGYVPVISCSIEWTWRHTRRTDPVPTRITMRVGTFGN